MNTSQSFSYLTSQKHLMLLITFPSFLFSLDFHDTTLPAFVCLFGFIFSVPCVSSPFFAHCFSGGILQVIYLDFPISLYTTSPRHIIYCNGFIHQCNDSQEEGLLEPMSVRLSDLGMLPSIFLYVSLLLMTQKKRLFNMLFSSAQFP